MENIDTSNGIFEILWKQCPRCDNQVKPDHRDFVRTYCQPCLNFDDEYVRVTDITREVINECKN